MLLLSTSNVLVWTETPCLGKKDSDVKDLVGTTNKKEIFKNRLYSLHIDMGSLLKLIWSVSFYLLNVATSLKLCMWLTAVIYKEK